MSYVISVDSGGTFSDCIVLDEKGVAATGKAPSTPHDYSLGVIDSVKVAAETLGFSLPDLMKGASHFFHGTTVGTNALLTRNGAKVGLIATKGHEDVLFIGRTVQKAAGLTETEIIDYAKLRKADPVVPRPLVKGVSERIDYKGSVIVPLNELEVKQAAEFLVSQGVEAIAVSLLWSFMNPVHERRIKELIKKSYPELFVTISSEIAPVIKEYERTATAAINAYLSKVTAQYMASLEQRIQSLGFTIPPLIMQSSGGTLSPKEASQKPVALMHSGPVGGLMGSLSLAKAMGHQNVISTDVGGTSFDVGIIFKGEPRYSATPIFEKYHVVLPVIDIASIGAGGGSIAWIESKGNLLKVGHQSAGAEPGPVCYDRGGVEPTVTDANVVLNRINPDYFLGGRRKLNRGKAANVIKERIADPMGISVEQAAMGIIDIIDANMASLVRKVTISRGYDPREFVLFAFGGAGPLQVGGYGPAVGVRTAIIPRHASEFSAYGIAGSDVVHLNQLSSPMVAPFDCEALNRVFMELQKVTEAQLLADWIFPEYMSFYWYAHLRYRGQVHEVDVPVPPGLLGPQGPEKLLSDFEQRYEQRYGKGTAYKEAGVEARVFEVRGHGRILEVPLPSQELKEEDAKEALKGRRPVYFKEYGTFIDTNIYDMNKLAAGNSLAGPSVIEAVDTTILIHPGQTVSIDKYLNLIMRM